MKRIILSSLAVLATLTLLPDFSSAQTTFKKPVAPGTLSDEDVAALKQQFTDPKTKISFQWQGSFSQEKLNTKDAERAKMLKKIPIRVTGALYEIKQVGGKPVSKLKSGTCWIYITDSDGKIVQKTSQSLDKMCPS